MSDDLAHQRPKQSISFSGGRTSAMMTALELTAKSITHEIVVTFANTGCEHPATLDFVHQCDVQLGFPTVWLEAVVDPAHGKGIRHKVVTYETASRDGEPFRAYIAKYGIPNLISPTCTTKLKTLVMESYLKTRGFRRGKKRNYLTAIGIRADEMDRVSVNREKEGFVYPLCDAGVTKQDVLDYWRSQPFDLQLPGEHYGNCTWCWKKSLRKLMTLASEQPAVFDFPAEMERLYGTHKGDAKAGHNGRRYFYRDYKSVQDIRDLAAQPFERFVDTNRPEFDPELDVGSACGESCEIGADDG